MTLPEEITDPSLQFLLASVRRAKEQHCILIYSMYDLESQVFDALRDVGFTAYGVGPFLGGDLRSRSPSPELSRELNKCMRWLDAKPPCSVIYIALGTMVKLDPAELQSMARGLEDCKRPFLWVIPQSSIKDLPEGFQQRTIEQDCGHIVPWAPQRDVLRHRSVAVFISHCGWNSILESMWEGVPIVACPFFAEQRSNARWIVQRWRIGLEMERGDDGSFTREAVREVLQTLLSHELGSQIRERASRMKDVIQSGVKHGGSSHQSLINFLGRLRLAAE
ncbi:hypothetical protein KP509_19G040600 [Ceratopteris richardii]|nr:hypothetical protein KP509_19G040600 [Ceratopteris richardii]